MRVLLVEPEYRTSALKKAEYAKRLTEEQEVILKSKRLAESSFKKAEGLLISTRIVAQKAERKRKNNKLKTQKQATLKYRKAKGLEDKRKASVESKLAKQKLKEVTLLERFKEREMIQNAKEKFALAKKTRYLLVNRKVQRLKDENLWYPPIGLMKLAHYHKLRGDEILFVRGCRKEVFSEGDQFEPSMLWDRVYITTLFTYHFDKIAKTINFYKKAVADTVSKIFVGGIMASVMPDEIFEATGIYPITGIITSSQQIGFDEDVNIDMLSPDYEILDKNLYGIEKSYYAYTSRGCTNKCPWCAVPKIEPDYVPYIDIKKSIKNLRSKYGDKPVLKLMDNNVLASPMLENIVNDLLSLGYGKCQKTESKPPKERVIDYNQGLDASFVNTKTIKLISKLNIKPFRIAFDRLSEKKSYINAVNLSIDYGFTELSNYLLFNFKDTPFDLFVRLCINIDLNKEYKRSKKQASIYSYPMRYAPIDDKLGVRANRNRDYLHTIAPQEVDWLKEPVWTPRFVRSIEIMKGATHGAISPTPSLAQRAIGKDFDEYILNLYMPEVLLRNRNKHETKVYPHEPERKPGTGEVEEFREFMGSLLGKQDERFLEFHNAVSPNSSMAIHNSLKNCKDKEIKKWLKLYILKA